MLLVKAQGNSSEQQKIAGAVDEPLEPSAKWRIGKLDASKHTVHLVEQTGDEEQKSAEHIPQVGSLRECPTGQKRDEEPAEAHLVWGDPGMGKPADNRPAKVAIEPGVNPVQHFSRSRDEKTFSF